MPLPDNFFTPEEVDAQIEALRRRQDGTSLQSAESRNRRMIQHLERFYRAEPEEDARSLERAWQRIVHERVHAQLEPNTKGKILDMRDISIQIQQKRSRRKRWQQGLTVLVAVLIMGLLIGSLVVILHAGYAGKGGVASGGGNNDNVLPGTHKLTPTVTSSAPSGAIGEVVYSTQETNVGNYTLAWSPDSKRIAINTDINVESWDATTGKQTITYLLNGPGGGVPAYAVAWSSDGKKLAASNDKVHIWNAVTGQSILVYPNGSSQASTASYAMSPLSAMTDIQATMRSSMDRQTVPFSGGNPLLAMAWSPDGKYMATAFDGNQNGNVVKVWNTTTGQTLTIYHGHSDIVNAVAWSPDGKYVASASYDGTAQVWKAATGEKVATYSSNGPVSGLAWSPDGKYILSTGTSIQRWQALTGKVVATYAKNGASYIPIAWSPDGKRIALGGKTVDLIDVATGKTVYTFKGNPVAVSSLAWSPNGKYIVSVAAQPPESGSPLATIQVWLAS